MASINKSVVAVHTPGRMILSQCCCLVLSDRYMPMSCVLQCMCSRSKQASELCTSQGALLDEDGQEDVLYESTLR